MKDEIKEKIDDIFWEVKKHPMDSDYLVKKEEMKLLLDYITNLQERCEYLERSNNRREDEIMSLRDECVDGETYKSRCEKAIEYIKDKVGTEIHDMMYVIDVSDILDILQGSDEEEKGSGINE